MKEIVVLDENEVENALTVGRRDLESLKNDKKYNCWEKIMNALTIVVVTFIMAVILLDLCGCLSKHGKEPEFIVPNATRWEFVKNMFDKNDDDVVTVDECVDILWGNKRKEDLLGFIRWLRGNGHESDCRNGLFRMCTYTNERYITEETVFARSACLEDDRWTRKWIKYYSDTITANTVPQQ